MMIEIACEISGNHGGSLDNCLNLIHIAKELDCTIKLQRFNPYRLAATRKDNLAVLKAASGVQLLDLYKEVQTPKTWWPAITDAIGKHPWSCSVFSHQDVDFVVKHRCPTLKIASFEIADLDLISYAAQTELPIVISANKNADETDIVEAFWAAEDSPRITMLYATGYGTDNFLEEMVHFSDFLEMAPKEVSVGLSDHTPDFKLARAISGTSKFTMIERHLCLPNVVTPDTPFSFTPSQMNEFVEEIRAQAGTR